MSKWKFAPEHDSIKDRCVITKEHNWENGWYGIYFKRNEIEYYCGDSTIGTKIYKKEDLILPEEIKNEYLKWLIKKI